MILPTNRFCDANFLEVVEKKGYKTCASTIAPQSQGFCLRKCNKTYLYKQNYVFETLLCRVKIKKNVKNNQKRKMIGFIDFSFWTKIFQNMPQCCGIHNLL